MKAREVPAGDFKQHCLRLMDEVAESRQPLIVTKRGKPVVKLLPADQEPPSSFGALKGTVKILGDVIAPIDVAWEADD